MATVTELENLRLELLDVGHQIDSIELKIKRMQRDLDNITLERFHLIPLLQKQLFQKVETLRAKKIQQGNLYELKQKMICTPITR